jgi:hypothetical protein
MFTVSLPPGRYRVSGRSPAVMTVSNGAAVTGRGQLLSGTGWQAPCSLPLSVTVTAHRPRVPGQAQARRGRRRRPLPLNETRELAGGRGQLRMWS